MSKKIVYSKNSWLIDKNEPADKKHYAVEWVNVENSINGLAADIGNGVAIAPQFLDGVRKGENFICSGFVAVDFDGSRSLNDVRSDPFVNAHASLIYTTPSHTREQPRFRVVFALEKPIKRAQDYADANYALAEKLGGDLSIKDKARCFFGSSTGEQWLYPNLLNGDDLRQLAERGAELRRAKSQQLPVASKRSLAADVTVTLATGETASLSNLAPRTSVHCPYHNDQRPSAFIVRSTKSGSAGIHCHACGMTFWQAEVDEYDFNAFEKLVEYRALNPEKRPEPQSVFDEFFPAEPTCFITQDRFLQTLPYMPGITLVKSGKGTGKTEALKKIVSDVRSCDRNLSHLKKKDRPETILLIGHRRTLLREAAAKLGLSYYKDLQQPLTSAPETLAVCLDSLAKFTEIKSSAGRSLSRRRLSYDLIILDESEQLFAHSIGGTLVNKSGAVDHAYDALKFQIGQAKAVIALDADLSMLTAQVLQSFRPRDWDRDTWIYHNKPRPVERKRVLNLFEKEVDLRDDLLNAIERGERCFVACNSKKNVKVLDKIIREKFGPSVKMMSITSDNANHSDEIDFVKNIVDRYLDIQVLICSPSLGTGIDITFPDPSHRVDGGLRMVDCVYGFFSANVNKHTDMDQQLSRVRNPGAVKVWISRTTFSYSTNFDVIRDDLARARFAPRAVSGYSKDGQTLYNADDPQLMIYSHVVAAERSSKNRLVELFCELRENNGWKIERVSGSGKKDHDRAHAEVTLWKERVRNLLAAPVLSDEEYFDLEIAKENPGTLSEKVRYAYERNTLERTLGTPLTYDIIRLNYDGKLVSRVALLAMLLRQWEPLSEYADSSLETTQLPFSRLAKTTEGNLLCVILRISGVANRNGFDPDAVFTVADLKAFADLCDNNRTMMEQLLGRQVRKDIQTNPVRQLNAFLKFCGLKLTDHRRHRVNKALRREYRLDRAVFDTMMGLALNFTEPEDLKEAWLQLREDNREWKPEGVPVGP